MNYAASKAPLFPAPRRARGDARSEHRLQASQLQAICTISSTVILRSWHFWQRASIPMYYAVGQRVARVPRAIVVLNRLSGAQDALPGECFVDAVVRSEGWHLLQAFGSDAWSYLSVQSLMWKTITATEPDGSPNWATREWAFRILEAWGSEGLNLLDADTLAVHAEVMIEAAMATELDGSPNWETREWAFRILEAWGSEGLNLLDAVQQARLVQPVFKGVLTSKQSRKPDELLSSTFDRDPDWTIRHRAYRVFEAWGSAGLLKTDALAVLAGAVIEAVMATKPDGSPNWQTRFRAYKVLAWPSIKRLRLLDTDTLARIVQSVFEAATTTELDGEPDGQTRGSRLTRDQAYEVLAEWGTNGLRLFDSVQQAKIAQPVFEAAMVTEPDGEPEWKTRYKAFRRIEAWGPAGLCLLSSDQQEKIVQSVFEAATVTEPDDDWYDWETPGGRLARYYAYNILKAWGHDGVRLLGSVQQAKIIQPVFEDATATKPDGEPDELVRNRAYEVLAAWGPEGLNLFDSGQQARLAQSVFEAAMNIKLDGTRGWWRNYEAHEVLAAWGHEGLRPLDAVQQAKIIRLVFEDATATKPDGEPDWWIRQQAYEVLAAWGPEGLNFFDSVQQARLAQSVFEAVTAIELDGRSDWEAHWEARYKAHDLLERWGTDGLLLFDSIQQTKIVQMVFEAVTLTEPKDGLDWDKHNQLSKRDHAYKVLEAWEARAFDHPQPGKVCTLKALRSGEHPYNGEATG